MENVVVARGPRIWRTTDVDDRCRPMGVTDGRADDPKETDERRSNDR